MRENNGYFLINFDNEKLKREEVKVVNGQKYKITSFPYQKWYLRLIENFSFGLFKFGWNYWCVKV